MPKQLFKIDQFHGGLNTHSDDRDIEDNQQSALEDVMVDSLGQIKMMGSTDSSVINTADNTGITGTMKAGYGIHAWKSDYLGAEDKGGLDRPADTAGELATGDDYVAMYDGHDGQVWVYSAATDDWNDDVTVAEAGVIDIGSSTTASALPTFYSMEGGLRVSDGNHTLNNSSKWYQYIDRTLFQSIANTVVTDGWFDYDQYISSPNDTSQWDGAISAYSISDGATYTPSLSAAATQFITSNDLADNAVVDFISKIVVTVTITTSGYSGSIIPGETDFQSDFTLTVGSGGSSSSTDFNGVSGTSYQVTSQSEQGNMTASGTKVIVYTFNLGDHYHNGSADGQEFDGGGAGDTSNGVRATLTSTDSGRLLASTLITAVSVTEGTINSTEHASLTTGGGPNCFLEVNIAAAPASPTVASGWDTIWQHGVSFIYDGNQESLIRTLYDGTDTEANRQQSVTDPTYAPITKFYIEHGTSSSFNRRITGAVWYARDAAGDSFAPWCAQIEYDFVKGVARVLATGKEFDVQFNADYSEYFFEVDHDYLATPNLVDTYLSRTGIDDDVAAVKANYATATIAGRRVYIGNVKLLNEDGSTEIKGDAMLKSPPNKFDIFPSNSVVEASINDGESIVKLETFADRILQFKQETLYIINISQDIEFLEDVHKYKGVSHPSMVCKTDYGIAWVNELGCYLYDGKQVINLLEKGGRKLIDDDIWQTHVIDAAAASSMIGYLPKKRQLIVVKDNGANANAGDIFLYDMVTQSWTFGDSKMTDSQLKSNFIVFQNELIYMHTNTTNDFVKWNPDAATSASNFQIVTKDIDFGEPGRNKKIYKVLVTYTTAASGDVGSVVTVKYDTNGRGTFDKTFANGTNFSSNVLGSANGWQVAQLKPGTSSEANNIKSFQLKFFTAGTVPVGFRINDISIVYRAKRPK